MRQRIFSSLSVVLSGCLAASATQVVAQTAVPDASGRLVFKANAHLVVLDIVVAGRDGKPVPGLRKEDFAITEDGKPQQIASFEEHTAGPTMPAALPELPPNVFTNIPRVTPVDSVTVLLFDALNTPLADQSFVRAQMLKFLRTVQPGRRVAIFSLGTRLRFVEGFSDDPAALAAALRTPQDGSGPNQSPLLMSSGENDANQRTVGEMYNNVAANPSSVNLLSMQSVQQFQAEQAAFNVEERVHLTLEALGELARYLAGIPGRKNLVWFSAGFPLNLFPNPDLQDSFVVERKFERQVQRADALLSSAQVAIYPVDARGAATDSLYSAEPGFNGKINMQEAVNSVVTHPGQPASQSMGEQAVNAELDSLQKDSVARNADHTAMDVIARDTGGQAFYNSNGLEQALARVMDHGARFYTVTYAPTDTSSDGRYRKIAVKLSKADSGAGYRLDYRRGYFAADAKAIDAADRKPGDDPLHPFMGPGMPASTQILFALRVKTGPVPSGLEPTPQMEQHTAPAGVDSFGRIQMATHTDLVPGFENSVPTHAGDNPKLKGKLTRYGVDFVIAASGLQLDPGVGGGCHGAIESTLVAYDREGRPVNWLVREVDLDLDAARYASVRENGVSFHFDIDLPKEAVTLRSGVYDLRSSLTGTLELPLSGVLAGKAPGLKSR